MFWRNQSMMSAAIIAMAGCRGQGGDIGTDSAALGSSHFNRDGDILIADQLNNRVIEIEPGGKIVWQFGNGPTDVSAASILGTNDAQRVGTLTLMAGTGAPPGTEPLCANGCTDNRVLLVNRNGHIVWQYGQFGVTGAAPNELSSPVQSTWLPNGHVLITDQGNQRIIEVDADKEIVWQYGQTMVSGCCGDNVLNSPNSAELLENGNVLISDENNNRAIEVRRDHHIVAEYTAGRTMSGVAFASRLGDGHTLITDSNNARIVEVDAGDKVTWQCATNTDPATNPAPLPTRAVRLRDGSTLISDQFNHRVYAVDHSAPCKILKSYGLSLARGTNTGYGRTNVAQGLNAPYDAKIIGDFTGLTPPRDRDDEPEHGGDPPAPHGER